MHTCLTYFCINMLRWTLGKEDMNMQGKVLCRAESKDCAFMKITEGLNRYLLGQRTTRLKVLANFFPQVCEMSSLINKRAEAMGLVKTTATYGFNWTAFGNRRKHCSKRTAAFLHAFGWLFANCRND